jgi:GNAT superfamily N-acetyltransferase
MAVRQAHIGDLDALVPLFDGYRQFYGQPSDVELARRFLFDRFEHRESVVFLAEQAGRAVGFTQLYPTFSSAAAARILVLNDLFVSPDAGGRGVGRGLLAAAADYGRAIEAKRLTLSTAADNKAAQSVYEHLGWVRSEAYWTYNIEP